MKKKIQKVDPGRGRARRHTDERLSDFQGESVRNSFYKYASLGMQTDLFFKSLRGFASGLTECKQVFLKDYCYITSVILAHSLSLSDFVFPFVFSHTRSNI